MSRLKDALQPTVTEEEAFGAGPTAGAMVNVSSSGQFGFMPDPASLVANANYVKPDIIAVLMESPRGFNDLPNSSVLHSTLKSMVERHAKQITGLTSTLSVEFVTNPVGGAGEEQEDVAKVSRAKSTPTFVWSEKVGSPFTKFLDYWILTLLGDPETGVPRVVSYNGGNVGDLLPDYVGMTVMFFEPDPTHTKVERAWLCTNMMPRTGAAVEGARDKVAAKEGVEHNIEFTAFTQVGDNVNRIAQKYLDEMSLTGVNVNLRPAIVESVMADVEAAESGFADQTKAAAEEYIAG